MSKPLFISVEGPDGSGKSTQIEYIKKFCEAKGYDVILTREPGGTKIGEEIRKIILDVNNTEMSNIAETLLYAGARAQHVEEVIKPALKEGKVVICDRFVDSSLAYQGYGRGLLECVEVVNRYAVSGIMPDITFLLKAPFDVRNKRMENRDKDRLELEKYNFHEKVYKGYLELEKKYPDRIMGIDAELCIEDVKLQIEDRLKKILG